VLFDAIMQAFGEEIPETSRLIRRRKDADALQEIQGARILLVEDNEINQQVAGEILEGAGLIVTLANNGQIAVDAVKERRYDAVLMDVQMPVMDGYTATKAIRKWESVSANADSDVRRAEAGGQKAVNRTQASNLRPPTSNIPIIAMTAHAMAGDEEKSLEAGMNGHVTKPIDPEQLFAELQKWIQPREKWAADRQQDASAEPSAPKFSEDDLPQALPGFDLEVGLRRLMGNKRLYRKLLLDFGSKYTGIAGEIRHALDAGDFEKTHSLVHNLKGLAGNLAATELQAATVEMEKRIKGGPKKISTPEQLDQKFVELEKAIFRALQAVQILGSPAEDKPVASSTAELSAVPPELLKEMISRIQAAAEMGDFKQISSIAVDLKARSKAMVPLSDRFIRLAEDFDFDGILKLVAELENTDLVE